jgi:drug/metabolite transporter (DMT)-like permease
MALLDAPAPSWPESLTGWLAALGIALICTVLAVLCFFAGLARLGPTRSALLSTAEPVATVLMAAWLLNQPLAPVQMLGGALILLAGILLVRGKSAANTG